VAPGRSIHRTASTVIATALALAAVFADEPARWLVLADAPRAADAALVLAGDPGFLRTKRAARLLVEGQVRLLIVTGGEPSPGDSAESLREEAIRAGVPPDRIRMEQVSHGVHESMEAIRSILAEEQIQTLAVVTSPYHQRRAVWAARQTLRGVAIVSRPDDSAEWRPEGWWKTRANRRIVLGEYAKLAYYLLRGWV
jgi:uncharacterized SAM-binding protein YcdF (DUF218 family)